MPNWKVSKNGNPYFKEGDFLVTVFESKRDPGYCWCISSDEQAVKEFSKGTFATKENAMADAILEYQNIVGPQDTGE